MGFACLLSDFDVFHWHLHGAKSWFLPTSSGKGMDRELPIDGTCLGFLNVPATKRFLKWQVGSVALLFPKKAAHLRPTLIVDH